MPPGRIKPLTAVLGEYVRLREAHARRAELTRQPLSDAVQALACLEQQARLVADPLAAQPEPEPAAAAQPALPGCLLRAEGAPARAPAPLLPPAPAPAPQPAPLPAPQPEQAHETAARRGAHRKGAPRRKRPAQALSPPGQPPGGGGAALLDQPINWDSLSALLEEGEPQRSFAAGLAETLAHRPGSGDLGGEAALAEWVSSLSADACVAPFLEAIVASPEPGPGAPARAGAAMLALGTELPLDLEKRLAMLDYS